MDTTVIRTLSALYHNNSHMRWDLRVDWLTPQTGQHANVSSIEQWQCIVIDVQVRKMRDEVIPYQETHQNPVIYDPLQVVLKRDLILMEIDEFMTRLQVSILFIITLSRFVLITPYERDIYSHPELWKLIVDVFPHKREMKQVKGRLLRSRYPTDQKNTL